MRGCWREESLVLRFLLRVRGFFGKAFAEYRTRIFSELESLGYAVQKQHIKNPA